MSAWARRQTAGFTIVELLIVIVVIGILAAITIVAYNGIQTRANATAVTDGIGKIEKAFRLHAATTGASTWWIDNQLNGDYNARIGDLIEDTDIKDYLQAPPALDRLSDDAYWFYDNDGDTREVETCDMVTSGVGLFLRNLYSAGIAQAVDDTLDDGNLNCGKVRYRTTDGTLIYLMSETQSF